MLAFIISFLYVQINYSTLRTLSSFLVDSDWSHVESNTVLKKSSWLVKVVTQVFTMRFSKLSSSIPKILLDENAL